MPKINHQITRFDKGLSLNIAKEDVADSVAVKNTHNALFDINGNVKGYPTPVNENITLDVENVAIWAGSVNLDGKKRVGFISFDDPSSTQQFQTYDERIANTAGTVVTEKVTIEGWDDQINQITMQQRMEHLYLGAGPQSKPKWIGKHKHTQFGNVPPVTLQAEDAELKNPSQITPEGETLPLRYIQQIGEFQYGISEDGTTLCKFENGILKKKLSIPGQNFTALCQGSTTVQIWVWSEKDSTANLYNEELLFQANIIVTGLPSDTRTVHDIIWLGTRLFFIRSLSDVRTDTNNTNRFYSIAAPIAGGGEVVTNHSHNGLKHGVIAPFPQNASAKTIDLIDFPPSETVFYYSERCLFVNGDWIGIIANFWCDYFNYVENSAPGTDIIIEPIRYDKYIFTDGTGLSGAVAVSITQLGGSNCIVWINNTSTFTKLDKTNFSIIEEIDTQHISDRDYAIYKRLGNIEVWTKRDTNEDAICTFPEIAKATRAYTLQNSYTDLPAEYVSESILKPKATFDGTLRWFFQGETIGKSGSLDALNIVEMVTISISTLTITEFPGGWTKPNQYYYYAFSYLYDGYQESGLSTKIKFETGAVGNKILQLQIKTLLANFPRRVSHLNIYRAKGTLSEQLEFMRMVDSISLIAPYPNTDINGAPARLITYNDNITEFELGPSFEGSAGFPESMDRPTVNYGISAAVEDFMFVGQCANPNIPDAEYMIFRSNAYSYSVFNWETNVLRLPTRPIAMIGYNSRLYIFDEAQAYIINPISLTIEEVIPGAGALNKDCVIATPMGIYVAGLSGIYRITGRSSEIVSLSIHFPNPNAFVPADDFGDYFDAALNGTKHFLVYEQHDGIIHFMSAIDGDLVAYSYNERSGGWSRRHEEGRTYDFWLPLTNTELLGFSGANVRFFMPKEDGPVFGKASGINYFLNLKPFDGDDANMDKWFYEVRIDCINDSEDTDTIPVVRGRADNDSLVNFPVTGAKNNGTYRYLVAEGFYRRKKLELVITGNAIIKAVSIVYRPKQVRS